MTPTVSVFGGRFGVWVLVCGLLAGCGSKQDAADVKPPEPFLPEAGQCPGALVGENIQVTFAVGESNFPSLVWEGDAFRIGWWDMRGRYPAVYTLRMSREGFEVEPLEKLPNKTTAKYHDMAYDGKGTHIVWVEDGQILSTRLSRAVPKVKVLSPHGEMPAAGPFGTAVWVDAGKLYFRSDGMSGGKEATPVIIATGGIQDPAVAYNGVFYSVVWSESTAKGRRIVLEWISPKGEVLGNPVQVSGVEGMSRKPTIAWAGGQFAVAWTNAAPAEENPKDRYRLLFAAVSGGGSAPAFTRNLDFRGSADQVALAATGEEYALAWVGSRGNGRYGSAIFMQRIDLDGHPLEETIEVSDGVPLTCSQPDLAWDGKGYALTWHDDRGQVESEVYMAYVNCGEPPPAKASPETPDASVPENESPPVPKTVPGLKEVF